MRLLLLPLLTALCAVASTDYPAATGVRPEIAADLKKAINLENRGQLAEAERLLLRIARAANGAASSKVELPVVFNNLGVLYASAGRYADAERSFKRGLRILERLPGELPAQQLANTKLHLAAMYVEAGRRKEVVRLDVPSIIPSLQRPEDRAKARGILAGLALLENRLADAEEILLEALAFWMEPSRADASDIEIATVLNNLGVIAILQNRSDTARERLEQSLQAWKRAVGPASPNIARVMSNFATAYMQARQYNDAALWLKRASESGALAFGESHPFTIGMLVARAEALKKAGRKDEAKEIARAASKQSGSKRRSFVADYTVDYRDLMSDRAQPRR